MDLDPGNEDGFAEILSQAEWVNNKAADDVSEEVFRSKETVDTVSEHNLPESGKFFCFTSAQRCYFDLENGENMPFLKAG